MITVTSIGVSTPTGPRDVFSNHPQNTLTSATGGLEREAVLRRFFPGLRSFESPDCVAGEWLHSGGGLDKDGS
jgi:hypothetical protein